MHRRIGKIKKNTDRNGKGLHMSLLLENSHAMHFQTMPMCIIHSQKWDMNSGKALFKKKKIHGCCLSGKEIQATFIIIHNTDLQQQTKHTLCSNNITYKYIHLCLCTHTHTHIFYYAYFILNLLNISNIRLKTVGPAALVSHPSFFFTMISLL